MRYMMLIKHKADYRGIKPSPALQQAMGEFIGEYITNGKFVDGAGLKSTHRAKKIQLSGGKIGVVDGPFTESKEIIGGYALMDLESDEEALTVATRFMELHRLHAPDFEGESELRVIEEGEPGSE
ncbi:MAG: YciI family protein [Gemmatimonadaceae bacterium]